MVVEEEVVVKGGGWWGWESQQQNKTTRMGVGEEGGIANWGGAPGIIRGALLLCNSR